MLDDLWFVAEGSTWSGPFTGAEVRVRVAEGRFAGALIWKPGWSGWESIDTHFAASHVASDAPAVSAVQESKSEPDPIARPAGRGVTPAVLIMTFVAIALGGLLFSDINYYRFGAAAAFVYAALWIVAVSLVIVIAVLVWRRAAIPGMGWLWQAGKALTAIAVIGALAFSVVFARMTMTIHDISEARRNFDTYELVYDPSIRTITFSGPIGPGFADRLYGILASNAGVRVLRIANSPGGLIDEALSAAEHIEREPDLVVEAAAECNSACFALFMAARNRRAEYIAEFGFHRSGLVSDIPAFARAVAEEDGDSFRRYVIERGLPADRYDSWTRSEELYAVSAIELRELEIVGQLLSDGVAVDAARAKWLWIAAYSADIDNGFGELARALADSREPVVLRAADPIFAAARSQDIAAIRPSVLAVLPALLPKVLESADPETTIAYLSASSASIGYLVTMERWDDCASIVDGRGAPENAIPNSLIRTELTALAAAVRSAATTDWVSRPLPSWAGIAGRQAIDATISEGARSGISNEDFNTDPRVRCLLTRLLLAHIEGGEPTRSIIAYRWILAN